MFSNLSDCGCDSGGFVLYHLDDLFSKKQYVPGACTFCDSICIIPFQRDYEQVGITGDCSGDLCSQSYYDLISECKIMPIEIVSGIMEMLTRERFPFERADIAFARMV